ncbi:peroxisome proliferator-activated receptor gamma coactivator-related protein 1 [Hemiscyllium ocellatum]|uniref:peroxisome proliferator-activated receptor gamma coactivator-related protein 1 n=1 Tax=Hemiscyllium ocellatum TaxID=170820 RepID=UPI0029662BFA|nr:peroxisome proliferator-activated receptor gamma coactivator-related protein 1 [Hemiscyllium ocellatum]
MAAPWAAGARSRVRDRRWRLRDTDLITGGVSKLEPGPQGQNLEDYHLPSSLLTVADSDLGGISGSFPGCIDQSIISIIEATAQTENKLFLDEESEASLLTALTEILDSVDDENPSPFDCIPDSELFAPPKDDQECLLVGHQSCATFPDLGKEPFGHVVPTAPRDLNAQWRSEKLMNRSFGEETSKQRSDGEEEEEEDLISNCQGVSELGPGDSLDLQLGEQLDAVGLENNVTLVLESSSPCAHDVPMSDQVKDVRLHCLPNGVMCLGTDIELADSMIELEVHVVQENEVQDLELPIVLCANSEHLLQMIGENDVESVLAKDPGPESPPQTLKQQEISPPSPVTVPSERLRKTSGSDEILIPVQLDRAETSCEHHSLETQVQAAEDQEHSIKVQQKQESQFLTQQTEQDVRRIKTRDVTARRESSQVTAFSKGAKEPHNPSPCESEPALGGCSIRQSVEPQPGHGVTLANEAIHPQQSVDNEPVPVSQCPKSDLISQHPGSTSSTISPLSTCDVQSPAVLETTTNESKLRSISLQQYRLRLQQRKRDGVLSVPEKPKLGTDTNSKSAWPVVPIQSIVQGELSILPLEPAGHVVRRQASPAQVPLLHLRDSPQGQAAPIQVLSKDKHTPFTHQAIPPTAKLPTCSVTPSSVALPAGHLAPPSVGHLTPPSLPPSTPLSPPTCHLPPPPVALPSHHLPPPPVVLTPHHLPPPPVALPPHHLPPPPVAMPPHHLPPPPVAMPPHHLPPPPMAMLPPHLPPPPVAIPPHHLPPPPVAVSNHHLPPPYLCSPPMALPTHHLPPPPVALPTLSPPSHPLTQTPSACHLAKPFIVPSNHCLTLPTVPPPFPPLVPPPLTPHAPPQARPTSNALSAPPPGQAPPILVQSVPAQAPLTVQSPPTLLAKPPPAQALAAPALAPATTTLTIPAQAPAAPSLAPPAQAPAAPSLAPPAQAPAAPSLAPPAQAPAAPSLAPPAQAPAAPSPAPPAQAPAAPSPAPPAQAPAAPSLAPPAQAPAVPSPAPPAQAPAAPSPAPPAQAPAAPSPAAPSQAPAAPSQAPAAPSQAPSAQAPAPPAQAPAAPSQAPPAQAQAPAPPAQAPAPPAQAPAAPSPAPPAQAPAAPSPAPPAQAPAAPSPAPPAQAPAAPSPAAPSQAPAAPSQAPSAQAPAPPAQAPAAPSQAPPAQAQAPAPPAQAPAPPAQAPAPPAQAPAPPAQAPAAPSQAPPAQAPPAQVPAAPAQAPPAQAPSPAPPAQAPAAPSPAPPAQAPAAPSPAPPAQAPAAPSPAPPAQAPAAPSPAPPAQAPAAPSPAPPAQAPAAPSPAHPAQAPSTVAAPTSATASPTLSLPGLVPAPLPQAPVAPTLPEPPAAHPAWALAAPAVAPPALAPLHAAPPAPVLATQCSFTQQLSNDTPNRIRQKVVPPVLPGSLKPLNKTSILALQPQQVPTTSVHKALIPPARTPPPSTLMSGDSECPSLLPVIGPHDAASEEDIPRCQNDLLPESVQRTTMETMLTTSPSVPLSEPPPVQQLQSSTATQAYEGVDQGNLKAGIEAADLMSLLEQFEVTEVSEESPGNSSGSEVPEEWKLLDHIFGAELASTAGLTPPATPPHQIWKSLPPPVCFLGKRKLQQTAEGFEGSPVRTAKLIDPKPMAQNNRTKCSSLQPSVEPPLTAANGFGDHIYCLPRVSTQSSSCNIYPPAVSQPDVACRWNIKRQANITIKPITFLNRQRRSPTHQARTGDQQRGAGPGIERNTSDSQKTLPGVQVSSNMLPNGTGSEKPSRSFSSAVDQRNIGGDTAEGNCCVIVAPSPNGETEGSKPFDSSHCSRRTRTSPCYRHQRYLSSSSSTSCSRSRSRSHSPTRKRRRYGRRRSRHSRHSSRSDSRSSSRSRSCSRSNSRSDSGSRSRSRSSRRRSVHMSYYADTYDVFPEEPRCQYSRAHSRRINQRRELAIEERRVVYVGKIRNGMLREELRRRFEVFGEIEDCNIYFRSEGDNYGFVTYRYTCDAFAAIENGQTLRKPDELPFDLCFGGRRQFCKTNYADLDSSHADYSSYSTKSKFDSLDFDTLLKQAKRSLRR